MAEDRTKLGSSRDVFARARAAGCDHLLIGFSGKDSFAVLDLALKFLPADRIKCFFMTFVPGLRCVEEPLDRLARRFHVELLKVPHFELGNLIRLGVLGPPRRGPHAWRQMKFTDTEQFVREKTGFEWMAYGHKMVDSLERRGMLSSFKGVNDAQKRVYPIFEWSNRDVYAYLRARRISLPTPIGAGKMTRTSGIDLRASTLRELRDKYPDDWKRLLEVFPYAPASIRADELRRAEQPS